MLCGCAPPLVLPCGMGCYCCPSTGNAVLGGFCCSYRQEPQLGNMSVIFFNVMPLKWFLIEFISASSMINF